MQMCRKTDIRTVATETKKVKSAELCFNWVNIKFEVCQRTNRPFLCSVFPEWKQAKGVEKCFRFTTTSIERNYLRKNQCKCHCSVPRSNNKQMHPYLSFHDFPTDDGLRARWVIAIRRDKGATFKILHGSTYFCSPHFRGYLFNPERLKTT